MRLGSGPRENFVFPSAAAYDFLYLFIRQDASRRGPRENFVFPSAAAYDFHYLFIR